MKIYLNALGLAAPGLNGWSASLPILTNPQLYQATAMPPFSPTLLPANERRRTTASIKLALQVAQEVIAQTSLPVTAMASVFAGGDADLEMIDKICGALRLADRPVSPTHFHNSVHNAAAGYFAIATASHQPSTSISAYHASFAAGLLEAATWVQIEHLTVLFVAYDNPAPPPLAEVCGIASPFATALLLTPEPTESSLASLTVSLTTQAQETSLSHPDLESLRLGTPAARSLPLLQAIANGGDSEVVLNYLSGQQLVIEVSTL